MSEKQSNNTNEAAYLAAVEKGKAICATMSGKQWALGDLAAPRLRRRQPTAPQTGEAAQDYPTFEVELANAQGGG
jgi:hypothetical protein